MKKIYDDKLLDRYIKLHKIDKIFASDLSGDMELLKFNRNEYICRENEAMDHLLFFVEGKAKIYTTLSNGKALLLCFYRGPEMLGDAELVNGEAASSNVQAIVDTYCIGLPFQRMRGVLLEDAVFLRFICDSLSRKLIRLSKNSSINLLYPLENRLASYILGTSESVDMEVGNQRIFSGNLTEISELLGASYRHLLRTLMDFCNKGILAKRVTYYEIMDEKYLKELASDLYH